MKKIAIDGSWYDVTAFAIRHPGGSVIESYVGQDATHVFREMHHRSTKAAKVLQHLPKVDPPVFTEKQTDAAMLADFDAWRQSLVDRGFFDPSLLHVAYRLSELLAIFGLATWCLGQGGVAWTTASVLLYGLFGGRCGWVQHEAGHRSFTGCIPTDGHIQKIAMGLGTLTSASMWNSMHNKHHATTQKIDHDIDLDTMPLVLFHEDAFQANRGISKAWMRFQAWTFLPVTSGMFIMLFWIFYLHPRKIFRDRDLTQAFYTLSGHLGRTYLIHHMTGLSWLPSYGLLMASTYVTGIYLFGHFSTSHTFMPVVARDENPNWVSYSLEHTVDIDTQNPWVSWWMGYLNCQCVHHLFPQMPQYRQPEVSRELEVFAKKWDLPYLHMGYGAAWYATFANMNRVGQLVGS